MSSYRPRPNDHLVEPLFGGLAGADPATPAAPVEGTPRRIGHVPLLLVLAAAAAALVWFLL